MSIRFVYRRIPVYLAVPLAVLASAVAAVTLAFLGVMAVDSLLDAFHGRADLGDTFLAVFHAGPAIALLSFVICFSILVNWHHPASWRAPTFAFALSAISVWLLSHDFGGIGFAWYIPGAIAWFISCWLFHRNASAHHKHVIEA